MAALALSDLRLVEAVAETGSFSAAARSLGFSQSAISRQVAAAETAAGRPLFVRGPRGVGLTPAAAVVLRYGRSVLAGADRLTNALRELDEDEGTTLRLGAFPAAAGVVPLAMAEAQRRHDGSLSVSLREAATPVLLRAVRQDLLDLAVVAVGAGLVDVELADLHVSRLPATELLVAVADGHRLAPVGEVDVSELRDEPWVAGSGAPGEPQFAAWPTLPDPVVRHLVPSWSGRLGLVAAGLGACVVPELAVPMVGRGVTLLRVRDPAWTGRAALVVGRGRPTPVQALVLECLQDAVRSVRCSARE